MVPGRERGDIVSALRPFEPVRRSAPRSPTATQTGPYLRPGEFTLTQACLTSSVATAEWPAVKPHPHPPMSSTKTILGLEVSKDKLDACLLTPQPRTTIVPNTPAGHAQLLRFMESSRNQIPAGVPRRV